MNENFNQKIYYWTTALYFALLIYCLQFFTWSDQYFYRLYYDGLQGLSFEAAYDSYRRMLTAREPMYFLFTYLIQPFFSKEWFDVIFSSFFFLTILIFLKKTKLPKIVVSLLLTSIYFLSIFYVTERLKLAVLFLLLYFIFSNKKSSVIFIFLALLSHAQILILTPFLYFFSKIKLKNRTEIAIFFSIGLFVSTFLIKHLMWKLPLYFQNYSFYNILKPLFFCIISYTFVQRKNWSEYFSFFIPIILVALFLGEGRMTLIAFVGSIYFWSKDKKITISSIMLLISGCYFSLKGISFLISAVLYGDAYALNTFDIIKLIL